MKKIMILFMVCMVFSLLLGGCGGLGSNINLSDYSDIQPFPYKVKFNIVSTNEDNITSSPFIKIDSKRANDIWKNITKQDTVTNYQSQNPKYIFNIEPLIILDMYIASGATKDYYGGSLFKLTVKDNKNIVIHRKLIKSTGYWYSGGFGAKGPAKMSMFGVSDAMIKLGLYDILAYACREDFLAKKSSGVATYNHEDLEAKEKPIEQGEAMGVTLIGGENVYSLPSSMAVYFKYIMGEHFDTISDLSKINWPTEPGDQLLMVVKLAHDKKWPYFPEGLDVSSLKYTFE